MLKTAPKIRSILPAGMHNVTIHSITEIDDRLMIKFINSKGYYCLYLELSPGVIKTLSRLSFIGGRAAGSKVTIASLVGLKYKITINNNNLTTVTGVAPVKF